MMLNGLVYPPVIKHGLLENGPFISNFPNKTSIHRTFPIAMFDETRGYGKFTGQPHDLHGKWMDAFRADQCIEM